MAKTGSTPATTPKSAIKDLEKAAEKAQAQAAAAGSGKPGVKPAGKDAKPTAAAALPDATLLEDEAGDAAETTPRGLMAWLPTGPRRWIVLGSVTIGLIVVVTSAVVTAATRFHAPPPAPVEFISGPAQAIDGATVTVAGQMLRLADIDAPAASLVCQQGAWKYRCGDAARRGLASAIGGGPVECVHPYEDDSGRLTALCRNENGLDIAAIQVETGWAVNDTRRSSRYVAEEMRARAKGNGLWRDDLAYPELWHEQSAAAR